MSYATLITCAMSYVQVAVCSCGTLRRRATPRGTSSGVNAA